MRKIIFIIFIIISFKTHSQVHLMGGKGIEIKASTPRNIGLGINFWYWKRLALQGEFMYEKYNFNAFDSVSFSTKKVYARSYYFNLSNIYSYRLKKNAFVNAILGATCVYDNISNISYTNDKDGLFFGINGGANLEFVFIKRITLAIGNTQYFVFKSKYSKLRNNIYLNLTYNY